MPGNTARRPLLRGVFPRPRAWRHVPSAKAERLLLVQSTDLGGSAWQRRGSAETGPSMDRDRTPGVDPLRSAYGLAIGSALILAEDAGRLAIVTCAGRKR